MEIGIGNSFDLRPESGLISFSTALTFCKVDSFFCYYTIYFNSTLFYSGFCYF